MNQSIKLRLAAFALPFVVMAFAIAWLARVGGRQIAELREGLLIAEQVDYAVIDLKGKLHLIEMLGGMEEWQQFLVDSQRLVEWMETERSRLTSQRENELLDAVASSYAGYLAEATELVDQVQRGELQQAPHPRIAALIDRLTNVRREGTSQFLADSYHYLESLQRITVVLLVVMSAVALGVFIGFYRGMIFPMNVKLTEASAALEQSQKLASLGILAAGVAHEIRNPLTAIKARLYTHQKAFAAESPQHDDTEFIGEEINRLERIVREFLQFARPSEPQRSQVSSDDLLGEIRDLLAPELGRLSIQLTLDDGAIPLFVDRHQIKQVLINLVQNAAESIGEKGTIALRARKAKSALRDNGRETLVLEVEDTGKGIPPEVQGRLYDPFFTTKPSGTGLGLSIAARIVEKHGGTLQFQTQLNHGTTFRIVLPADQKA